MPSTANRCLPYLQSRTPRTVACGRCGCKTSSPATNGWWLIQDGDHWLCPHCERFAHDDPQWPYFLLALGLLGFAAGFILRVVH
jgi:hypothetical protein